MKDYLRIPKYSAGEGVLERIYIAVLERKLPFKLVDHPGLKVLSVPIVWVRAM